MTEDPTRADWTISQIEATVASYAHMLRLERNGSTFNKAEFNRTLQISTGRSRGSIEYKLQNISAVFSAEGAAWIQGYKPAKNFQNALREYILGSVDLDEFRG